MRGGLSGTGTLDAARIPPSPSCNPLYVRVRATVADWDVTPEARKEFLVLDPRVAPLLGQDPADEQCGQWNDLIQTHSTIRGGALGTGTGATTSFEDQVQMTKSSCQERERDVQLNLGPAGRTGEIPGPSESGGGIVGPDTAVGVLEHMIREVLADDEFGMILDNILTDATPHFVQYEDSQPPGEPAAPAHELVQETLRLLAEEDATAAANAAAGGPGAGDHPELEEEGLFPYRSDLLLDFEAPRGLGLAGSSSTSSAAQASTSPPAAVNLVRGVSTATATGGAPATEATSAAASLSAASPSSAVASSITVGNVGAGGGAANLAEEASGAPAGGGVGGGFEDTPQGYWEEALHQYGEVDLETFRRDAGEVLEHLLLDMVDDVVSGRLNWQRPLHRPKPRR